MHAIRLLVIAVIALTLMSACMPQAPVSATLDSLGSQGNIRDSHSAALSVDAIRSGDLFPLSSSLYNPVSRSTLFIHSIVVDIPHRAGLYPSPQNGTSFFRIETALFFSMRNVSHPFLSGASLTHVISSEELCYPVSIFISARNAAPDPSTDGAFRFLKSRPNHEDLLAHISFNRVRLDGIQIVVDPPQEPPDHEPPVINSIVVSQIDPNPVEYGQIVSATVVVSASSQSSSLKHAQVGLFVKPVDAPDTSYQQVANVVVPFPDQSAATIQHRFDIPTGSLPFTVLGQYVMQARAKAEDIMGNQSFEPARSQPALFVFSPVEGIPSVPELLFENQVNVGLSSVLSWHSQGAAQYDLYFGTSPNPPLFAPDLTVQSWSFLHSPLQPGMLFYWRVVAKNAHGSRSSVLGRMTTAFAPPPGSSIELVDHLTSPFQRFTLSVKGYSITQLRGMELTIQYDPHMLELDYNHGHPVNQGSSLEGALIIYEDHSPGNLTVSIATTHSVSLHNQEALQIFFRSKEPTGVAQVTLSNSSSLINADFQEIPFTKVPGRVFVEPSSDI